MRTSEAELVVLCESKKKVGQLLEVFDSRKKEFSTFSLAKLQLSLACSLTYLHRVFLTDLVYFHTHSNTSLKSILLKTILTTSEQRWSLLLFSNNSFRILSCLSIYHH